MSILVTGAQGQVGYELLIRRGDLPVVGLGRTELDLTDAIAIDNAFAVYTPRIVINAAAYTAVDKAESDIAAAYAVNRDAPGYLAAACARTGAALLHLSTDYVFNGNAIGPIPVDAPAAPLGVYGDSKWQGECLIREGLNEHLIMRVAWVFGAHGNNFVKTMLRLGRERDELRVVADQRGGPTPAAAIAECLHELAQRYLAGGTLPWGTYHYCGQPETSWHGFAEAIFIRAVAKGLLPCLPRVHAITSADYPTPARRPTNSMLDCTGLTVLGIASPDWRAGLDAVLEALSA